MDNGNDVRPRHQQIAADLRAQIMAGDLAPGQQLPSTQNLVHRFSAANATIQRALTALKREGFVYSLVGKGVYVRDRRPFVVDAATYLSPSPKGYAYRLLDVAEVQAPTEISSALDLTSDGHAILRQRLLSYDGEPIEISWSYYPADIAADGPLARKLRIPGGAVQALAELGYPQREFADRLSARLPTTEELEILGLPEDVPIIRQFRTIYSDNRRPVEASVLVKGAHLYELRYHQAIPQPSD
ncbi:GntR family transcriptional regulator [Kribbella catacumbae]|uniref:GntR family transcriptional regulator n=1 Tax=Kribbella catacumbae TaxID=460086 RepID=UPI000476F09D|nr:GntR family transcriptional regulator [Kribbella catacumbae]